MTRDKRFALLTSDGDVLYPYQKNQRKTGRYGFALKTPEHGPDRTGGGYYTKDLTEAAKGVIFKGWGIRVCTDETLERRREGTYMLGEKSVKEYWLAPELRHIAQGATKPPVEWLPLKMSADTSTSVKGEVQPSGLLEAEAEVEADPKCRNILKTTRQALINARIGQGGYRQRMLDLWGGKCALTGCTIEIVLVASHAKQWTKSTNNERLDEYNGLLLAASVDRLYDAGLISFADDGQILLSGSLGKEYLTALGLSTESKLRKVTDKHKPYWRDHRLQHGFEI